MTLRDRDLQQLGHLLPAVERALRGGPDLEPAVLVPHRDGDVRLDVALVHAGRAELALDDHVGLGKPLGDVPLLELEVRGDVRRLVALLAHRIGAQVVVQQGSVVLHRVEHPGHAGQQLVVDLDLCRGLFGQVDVGGGHGRHGMALVQDLVLRQAVGGQVGQVHLARLAHDGASCCPGRGNRRRVDDREHARASSSASLASIDLILRVGVRAPHASCRAPVRQLDVGGVDRLAGDLVGAVVADGRVPRTLYLLLPR